MDIGGETLIPVEDEEYIWLKNYISRNENTLYEGSTVRRISPEVSMYIRKVRDKPRFVLYGERRSLILRFKNMYGGVQIDDLVRSELEVLVDKVVALNALISKRDKLETHDYYISLLDKEV